jgi:hypothetical protein
MFDTTEIKTQLGIASGSGLEVYADMYFDFVETYLENKGLTFFTADTTAVEEVLPSFGYNQSIFILPFWIIKDNIQEVKITRNDETETITDYILKRKAKTGLRPYKEIELLKKGYALSITGVWGFGETLPKDLYFVFYNLLLELIGLYKKQLQKNEADGQEVSSLKVDEITYTFRNGNSESQTSITNLKSIFDNNQSLQQVLMYYV